MAVGGGGCIHSCGEGRKPLKKTSSAYEITTIPVNGASGPSGGDVPGGRAGEPDPMPSKLVTLERFFDGSFENLGLGGVVSEVLGPKLDNVMDGSHAFGYWKNFNVKAAPGSPQASTSSTALDSWHPESRVMNSTDMVHHRSCLCVSACDIVCVTGHVCV